MEFRPVPKPPGRMSKSPPSELLRRRDSGLDKDRPVGAEDHNYPGRFERGKQGNSWNLDVADNQGRNVQRGVRDDNLCAVRLQQNKVVSFEPYVVD